MDKNYILKCPNCGFEFSVLCDEKDFEENKDIICKCPCGETMEETKNED